MNIDLSGSWELICSKKNFKPIKAQIPGDNASALMEAGLLPDPNINLQEKEVQWIREYDWTWSKTIRITEDFLAQKRITLNIDYLDTVGTVFINGKKVLHSENMFLRIRQDVKKYLRPGDNRLEVKIERIEPLIDKIVKKYPTPARFVNVGGQVEGLNRVRKIQCQGGWDWGICVMVSGMYGKVCLEGDNGVRIDYVTTEQKHKPNCCKLNVTAEVSALAATKETFEISFAGQVRSVTAKLTAGINKIHATFELDNPELWYPTGYGPQKLYELKVSAGGNTVIQRIGLRDMQVISQKDSIGVCLYFKVNGINVFAKGADWIPMDPLPQRYTRERYDTLLSAVVAANMNCLRIWGGGLYEMDAFYDLCDEKGILLWQDCMFACANYADDEDFLTSITQEITYQVKRLQHHASIALWCGDNECSDFFRWTYGKPNALPLILQYDRFNQAVGKAVRNADNTRRFWKTSPCNGNMGGWHDDTRGDMHYWQVWHGGASFDAFYKIKPRFCSEFGFQAFPSLNAIRNFAQGRIPNVTSPVMEYHQRCTGGNSKIVEMFTRYFRFPSGTENMVYLSQVQQAMAIKSCVEYWRTLKPRCMGTIYWQLNDNWPVASWSSLDYYGNWKQLHYHARRFYSPVAVFAIRKEDMVELWLVSDLEVSLQGKLQVQMLRMDGASLKKMELPVKAKPQESLCICRLSLAELGAICNQDFLFFELQTEANGMTFSFQNECFLANFKEYELPEAKIKSCLSKKNGKWTLELKTDAPAFYVFAEFKDIQATFSDNSFTLLPDKPRILSFQPQTNCTKEELQQALSIRHLRSSFEP